MTGMKIFSHQVDAYSELVKRAETYFAGHWRNLPINTRWHSLIIGPTGSGKSALASKLAEESGALLRINVTGWIPSGAHNRAVAETISSIIEHIHAHPRSILFFDEIDKLMEDTAWNSYIRGELFELLDGRFPVGSKGTAGSSLDVDDDGTLTVLQRIQLDEKLSSSTFIIAAGTFQEFYETQGVGKIGFHPGPYRPAESMGPTAEVIVKRLPRELLNRFNSSILLIPQLESSHYELIAQQAERSLPEWIRPAFRKAASIRMKQAIAAHSGCRYVEEALSDALKTTKAPSPELPEPEPSP